MQYLAAGYAAGKVDGSDWNTVVEKRLLAPIGMGDTFTYGYVLATSTR